MAKTGLPSLPYKTVGISKLTTYATIITISQFQQIRPIPLHSIIREIFLVSIASLFLFIPFPLVLYMYKSYSLLDALLATYIIWHCGILYYCILKCLLYVLSRICRLYYRPMHEKVKKLFSKVISSFAPSKFRHRSPEVIQIL